MTSEQILKLPVHKSFIHYVSLSILSMLGTSFYILADTFFIANSVGSDGLTALNIVIPVFSFIFALGMMIGIGGATRFSIQVGEKKYAESRNTFSMSIVIGLVTGTLLMLSGLLFAPQIVQLLGATGTAIDLGHTYLRTLSYFIIAFILNSMMIAFIRNDGNPRLATTAMLAGNVMNVLFDYIFLVPLNMGMLGAALATGIAPIISLSILSLHWKKKEHQLYMVPPKWQRKEMAKIVSLGLPSYVTELSSGIVIFLFNAVILHIAGNVGVAAYGIITNIAIVGAAMFNGIGQGIQPLISINFGGKNQENLNKILRYALVLSLVVGALLYTLGAFFADSIVQVFNNQGDPVMAAIAKKGIQIYFAAFLFMGLNTIGTYTFSSIAKARHSFAISLMRGPLSIIPFLAVLSGAWELNGVWLTVPFAELATTVLTFYLLKKYFNPEEYFPVSDI